MHDMEPCGHANILRHATRPDCSAHSLNATMSTLLAHEAIELQHFLRALLRDENATDAASSEQALFPAHQMLVTSQVCVEQHVPGRWPLLPIRWFRHGSAASRSGRVANLCEERAPRITTAGKGGVWLPSLSAVAPCDEVGNRTFQRHDYCFAPREFGRAPANETTWLRGLYVAPGFEPAMVAGREYV